MRSRDDAGQTAAEYLGLLLVVAVIVLALVGRGVADSLVGGIERAVCTVAAAGDGTGCGAGGEGGEGEGAPDSGSVPAAEPVPTAPADPGGPEEGPALGDDPFAVPDLPWDGSMTVEGEVKDTDGLYVESSVTLQEDECRYDAAGNPVVSLGVSGTFKAGARYEPENPAGGVSADAYIGDDVSYTVTASPETAQAWQDGDRPPPNPIDPSSIPEGAAITLDEASYAGLDLGATYRGIQLSMGFEEGRSASASVERVDPDTVRVTVGDADLVRNSLGLAFGTDQANLEASSTRELSDGETRQVDIDVSTPAGRAAYTAFVRTGRLPEPGSGVGDPRASRVVQYDGTTELGGTLGPWSASLFDSDATGTIVETTNPDGTITVSGFGRQDGVGISTEFTVAADGTEGPRSYVLAMQGVSENVAQFSAQLDGNEEWEDVEGGDVQLAFDDADLLAMQELAVDQVVLAADREEMGYSREEIEQLLEDREMVTPFGADPRTLWLAEADEPLEMARAMLQFSAGNADVLASYLNEFRMRSAEAGSDSDDEYRSLLGDQPLGPAEPMPASC